MLPSRGITKFLMPYKTKHNKTVKTLDFFKEMYIAVKMSDGKHLERTNFTT